MEENKLSGYKIVDLAVDNFVYDPDANDDLTITIRSGNVNDIFKVVQPAPPTETGIIELTKIVELRVSRRVLACHRSHRR